MNKKQRGCDNVNEDVAIWWSTDIIEMRPGVINYRGRAIEDLIGNVTFPQMIWFMIRGDMPSREKAFLFECALVSAVDHGPQAPSIAAARMAATCGLGLNSVMATGINMLGDVHGGAGEQAIDLFMAIRQRQHEGAGLNVAVTAGLDEWVAKNGEFVSGFGHRFHKLIDPRVPRLLELTEDAAVKGVVSGNFAAIGRQITAELAERKDGKVIPMNIDGATAVILAELGFPAPLARGVFCLSRSVGILAHGWEQMQQGGRNKGPTPPNYRWKYTGPSSQEISEKVK